jgi:hypothetical protein
MNYEDVQTEILQRVRRIETRQMVIAKGMGLDPKGTVRVTLSSTGLNVTGLDVSLGDLLDFCRKSGIKEPIRLWYRKMHIGDLAPGRLSEPEGTTKESEATVP